MGTFSSTTRLHLWPLSCVLEKRRHYNITTILTGNKERRTGTLCYSCSQHRHPRAMRKHTFECCNWNIFPVAALARLCHGRTRYPAQVWGMAFRANLAPQNSSGVEQNAKGKTGTFFPVQEGFTVIYAGGELSILIKYKVASLHSIAPCRNHYDL